MSPLPTPPDDFDAFLRLSARVGSDFLLTQGAGGNTSIKSGGITWVKASGTWLSEALDRPIMVPVRTAPLVAVLATDLAAAERPMEHVVAEANPSGLRPSLEAAFHCALPQRVVAHYHGVDALALLVTPDRDARVAAAMQALPDVAWQMIGYHRPGAALAADIAARLIPGTNLLFLANHGVILCGESVDEVAAGIERLSAALAQPARPVPPADLPALEALAARTGYLPAPEAWHHVLATDPVAFRAATAGVLMPDQAIFLGAEVAVAAGPLPRADAPGAPALLLAEGAGTLVRPGLSAGAVQMLGCMAETLRRLSPEAEVEPLGPADVDALLNWEAERYRQSLDRPAAVR